MEPVQGKNVVLFFFKDGGYQEFVCATECSIKIDTELKDVRTINGGKWKKKRGQSLSYRVSLSGLIMLETGSPRTFWLVDNQIQFLDLQWRMMFEDVESGLIKIADGFALIASSELTSSSTSFANSNFEFDGNGELTLTDSATSCNATIGEISVGPGDPDSGFQVSVSYEDVVNAARLEYSIDGGAREVIFDPGSFGAFSLSGLSEGSHTITIWVVCASGVDGEQNDLIFEIEEGGEPGPTCSVPGTPVMSAITTTTATATWTASPSTPAAYDWEVLNGLTVINSGTTAGLSVGLTGLPVATSLTFRVKAICEEGVSESGFVSVGFTTNADSCTAPTNLVVDNITTTTADGSWDAASPVPGSGYQWVLIEYPSMTIVQSGNEPGLSISLTGLTPATQYDLAVRSVCGVGDFSGYITETFATM